MNGSTKHRTFLMEAGVWVHCATTVCLQSCDVCCVTNKYREERNTFNITTTLNPLYLVPEPNPGVVVPKLSQTAVFAQVLLHQLPLWCRHPKVHFQQLLYMQVKLKQRCTRCIRGLGPIWVSILVYKGKCKVRAKAHQYSGYPQSLFWKQRWYVTWH